MIKLSKQPIQKSARLFMAAALLVAIAVIGMPAPASASAAVFNQENWGKLSSNNTSLECLTAQGQGYSVRQSYCLNSPDTEFWHFNAQGNGYYTIESRGNPGMCLDVYAFSHANYYANSANDGLVTTWPCNGFTNQQWYVNWVSNDSFSLKPRHAFFDGPNHIDSNGHWSPWGKCLDVFSFAHYDWAPVVQWQCNGAVNQLWTYHPVHL